MKYDFVVPMKSPNLTCSTAGVQSSSVLFSVAQATDKGQF